MGGLNHVSLYNFRIPGTGGARGSRQLVETASLVFGRATGADWPNLRKKGMKIKRQRYSSQQTTVEATNPDSRL